MTNSKKQSTKASNKALPSNNKSSSSKNNSKTYPLTIELVPSTCFFTNVRSEVTKKEWDILRRHSYKKANYKCELCSDTGLNQGFNHPVECHEIWNYNDRKKTQTLDGLVSLCPKCHKCKHVGLAQINGEMELVLEHLQKVNKITKEQALDYIKESFEVWQERSKHQWKLNIDYIQTILSKPE